MRAFILVPGAFFLAGCEADLAEIVKVAGAVVGALIPLATVITGLTPTPKDDAVLAKILPFLSVVTPKDAPGTFKLPLTPLKK